MRDESIPSSAFAGDSDSGSESDGDQDNFLHFPDVNMTLNAGRSTVSSGADLIDDDREDVYVPLPDSISSLRKELLGDYKCPTSAPRLAPVCEPLTYVQELSLKHFIAWRKSNGTVLAYNLHAAVLGEGTGQTILSLHACQKLGMQLTDLIPHQVDICQKSCIAYVGPYKNMTDCPFIKDGKKCGQPRWRQSSWKKKTPQPQAQMLSLPVMATIKALFANADTAQLLRHRDRCLQEALNLTAYASKKYSDFGNGEVHKHHYKMGLFKDAREVALSISTDGAQLTMKKQSATWLVIVILLNLPAEIRYKSHNYIKALATPGPNSPGDIESFIYSLFQEMAMASEGIWTWDAVESSYFINKAYICMALGDMLGSAKLNGMAGHSAIYGDRFSMVKGARSSKKKGAKAQYYPLAPPSNTIYNPDRPAVYNPDQLPMREETKYWNVIAQLQKVCRSMNKLLYYI
jgi:hypothetical protein